MQFAWMQFSVHGMEINAKQNKEDSLRCGDSNWILVVLSLEFMGQSTREGDRHRSLWKIKKLQKPTVI